MADALFNPWRQLSKGQIKTIGDEYGIIPKSACSCRLPGDPARYLSLKQPDRMWLMIEGNDRFKAGLSIGNTLYIFQ